MFLCFGCFGASSRRQAPMRKDITCNDCLVHLYFSLRASVDAGLSRTGCQTKLEVNGVQAAIDTRGEGGFVLAPPTTVAGLSSYTWGNDADGPSDRCALPAMPPWLVAIVNGPPPRTAVARVTPPAGARDGMPSRRQSPSHLPFDIVMAGRRLWHRLPPALPAGIKLTTEQLPAATASRRPRNTRLAQASSQQ